jgi:hypothetical protein
VPRSKQQHALLLLKPAPTITGERDERIEVSVLEPNRCICLSDDAVDAALQRQGFQLAELSLHSVSDGVDVEFADRCELR